MTELQGYNPPPEPPVESTRAGDPAACYLVEVLSEVFGGGIYGYYTSLFDAKRVERFLLKNGCRVVGVAPYDPHQEVKPGIHPYADLLVKGFS